MLAVRVMQVRRSGAKVTSDHSMLPLCLEWKRLVHSAPANLPLAHVEGGANVASTHPIRYTDESLSPSRAHGVPAPSSQAHRLLQAQATTDAVDGASNHRRS
jgi:hypothetical protein